MISLTAILCFVSIFTFLYLFKTVKKKQSYWAEKGIKYLKPRFFFGNIDIFPCKSFAEKQIEWFNAFPDERYYGIYQFLQPTLVIQDPDLIKLVAVKEFDHFLDHQTVDLAGDSFCGKNLFFSSGEKWRDLRSTLTPAFTGNKMRLLYPLMEECAQNFATFFTKQPLQIVEIEAKDATTRYITDVIAATVFGLKCNSLENRENRFYLMGKDGADFGDLRGLRFFANATLSKFLKIPVVPTQVREYFCKIVENAVTTRRGKNIIRPDMLHLLMEAQPITPLDVASQAFVFFLAGFDTVSSLISFALYELAINPEIQSRLRREIASVSGQVTYEALSALKYLEMVVSETLRKWPAVVVTDRKVTKAYTIRPERADEKAVKLEEGDVCWFLIYGIHRNPRFYPDPDKFDPERFSDENKRNINSFAYLPFGAGPRNCIGARFALLETKLVVCHVLRSFEIIPVKRTRVPMILDESRGKLSVKRGMWLGLKKLIN